MTSSKDSPIYFVLTFFTQRSHLFCFVFWWMHMIVYMPSGHGCACTSTFMHMHGVWRTTSGMLLLRYYLVSVWQESLTDLGLTWFSWPALLANSGDPLRYLQDNKDLAPHLVFFFFLLFSFIDTEELIQILVLAQEVLYWLSLCPCLVGQGFQQFRLVLNSLYSQGRIRTPDPLTSNCQKMLGLQARTNHHVGLAPKCFESCCGIILYIVKMCCSHC